ncbi:MAG: molybdopterin-dependent oxidoreductase [Acidobacteriota bacterium]|nr:MAG: molybdopterin-dependent oxidoreductase [Acidobacteriota bacterium]
MRIAKQSLIGKSFPKLDAPERASGRAVYIQDMVLPRMLHGAILRTDRVHARIVAIDTSAAERLPGVQAVITANDIDNVPFGHGKDNTPLKGDKVRCIRDEITAVAAETESIAREAAALIRVEYDDLPPILSVEQALRGGAPLIHEHKQTNVAFTYEYSHGDLAAGERESDVVVQETYRLPYVTHCCLGTSGIIAAFDARGHLTLYSVTQVPALYRRDMAQICGVPPERIRVIQATIGGGFGSKLDIYPYEPIAVHLARRTNRPVKIVFNRQEEFVASPTRQPTEIRIRAGAKRDGTFTFREIDFTHDNGGYTSWGATTPFVMMQAFSSLYRVPHVSMHGKVVHTNNPYAGAMRGYGNLQATFAVESSVELLAGELGTDPLELRLRNAQEPGETTGQGIGLRACGLRECLETAAKRSGWHQKRNQTATDRPRVRRGIGMASMLHVGGGAKIYRSDGCGTILRLDDFARLTLITGSSEIGQGSETVLAQIAAEELGLRFDQIQVLNNDTDVKPWDVGVHASRTTFIAGNSVRLAAREARKKLLSAAADQLRSAPEELDLRAGKVVRDADGEVLADLGKVIRSLHFGGKNEVVVTHHYYEPPSVMQDQGYKGDVSAAYAFATQVAEVEVDLDTGVVKVLRLTAAHDIGRVINRLGAEGQVQGGVVMGLGYALSEELQVERGRIVNPSFREYKLITSPEVPEIDIAFVETIDPEGPYGAKGIAEAPAICTAPAVANAVRHATGGRFTALPLTPERVFSELKQ